MSKPKKFASGDAVWFSTDFKGGYGWPVDVNTLKPRQKP